ncbi:hypothetical protein ACRALDRAFT_1047484 [Sodiomyces alcalophilus JCM 7366]|uniref:uncharacterized protein n=1 Tax=Sodiomyces alcalophilus JCM 7366 TaxID=591952 RepID=UPI0039B46FAF
MPTRVAEPEKAHPLMNHNTELRAAPLAAERSFRDMMSSAARNRSEDRAPSRDKESKDKAAAPSSLRENTGFFHGLRNSSTKAADMISKGLFGKSMRSVSSTEREPIVDDENYVLKVINLPLVEQTRLTRISKRLEDSRDKTEFWLPAFPWRAIDYLNYKGCDVEGLYRIPGSGPQIKKWQRRFDEEYDVNLFEQDDLYDINIIGSMLKAWLRELPDELFPKEAQNRVARECAGAETVPELLIEELSNLPPFNYYLLFAITCHLSLLLAHSDKNKMDFRNLCICFQPCMKIDVFCFKFLVCDWRDCWRGCKYEAKYIEEEYQHFDLPPPQSLYMAQALLREQQSAQDSLARQTSQGRPEARESAEDTEERQQPILVKKKPLLLQDANGSGGSHSTADSAASASATLTIDSDQLETPKRTTELRPLSPIKPLSPLGF